MFTLKLSAVRDWIDQYDPYGFLQLNAWQGLFVGVCFFLINFTMSPPYFATIMTVPALGFMAIGSEQNFDKRLWNMLIFCILCVVYGSLLTLLNAYPILVILAVGVVVFVLFYLSQNKYPQLFMMIPIIHVVAYMIFLNNLSLGTTHTLYNCFNYGVIILLTVLLMSLFPRVYFFRVFVRSLYLTFGELSEKIHRAIEYKINPDQLIFKHLLAMQNYSYSLGHKENGWAAKKISLRIMHIYTFFIAFVNQVESVDPQELVRFANYCRMFQSALEAECILPLCPTTESTDPVVQKLFSDLAYIISVWNRVCPDS